MDTTHLLSWKNLAWAVGILIAIGRLADHATLPEARLATSCWLANRQPGAWASAFAVSFDAVFGTQHLSMRCLARSALASIIALSICLMALQFVQPGMSVIDRWAEGGDFRIAIAFAVCVLANVVVDYVSLLETRFAVSAIMKRKTVAARAVIVALDFILTLLGSAIIYCILIASATFSMALEDGWAGGLEAVGAAALAAIVGLFSYSSEGDSLGFLNVLASSPGVQALLSPFLWSTYLTSVLLWLFIAVGIVNRLLGLMGKVYERAIGKIFNIKEKPFIFIGIVCSALVTILFFLAFFVQWIRSRAEDDVARLLEQRQSVAAEAEEENGPRVPGDPRNLPTAPRRVVLAQPRPGRRRRGLDGNAGEQGGAVCGSGNRRRGAARRELASPRPDPRHP